MKKTIVDITQLAHWAGILTGIPRVMNELAVRFREMDSNAVFVVWVKALQTYCEVDLEQTLENRGKGIVYLHQGETTSRPTKTHAAAKVPAARSHILKRVTAKAARVGVAQSARISPRLSEIVGERARKAQFARYKQVQPQHSDTLIVLWGEWWDKSFIAMLEDRHKDGVKLVQILYDMSPIVVPQFSNSGNATETYPIYCRRIFPITDLVLSISQHTKQDAIEWLKRHKLKIPRIEVFRLGDDIKVKKPVRPTDPAFVKSGLKGEDYILSVGTFELKKNHMLMYYVYKHAKSQGIELPKFVIAGRRGWMTEATHELMAKDPDVRDKFVLLHNESDEGLSWLYNNCLFTVLASFYEGWGIPIAESVGRGVPCICSNTSSMTEVAEGYVTHFSPTSTDECLAAMQHMLKPSNLEAARKKVKKYKQFSWDTSFAQVKKYLEEV